MRYQTSDLDEAIHAVGAVYCPHELHLDRRARTLDTRLSATESGPLPLVRLAYGARVEVDAGEFPDLFLFMRCTAGEAAVSQGNRTSVWHTGATIPVSAGRLTRFDFGPSFEQITLRPDTTALEACCASLVGRPLDDGLKFDLAPFTPELERTWSCVLDLVQTFPAALPAPARRSLEHFVLMSLLHGHPHNYTRWMQGDRPVSRPARLASRAEALISDRIDDLSLTVSDIASSLGVSVRALQSAFQEHRAITPTAYLRQIRLAQVREQLLDASDGDTITDIAFAHGFFHLSRFAQQYKLHFGEAPSDTLRARRRRTAKVTGANAVR